MAASHRWQLLRRHLMGFDEEKEKGETSGAKPAPQSASGSDSGRQSGFSGSQPDSVESFHYPTSPSPASSDDTLVLKNDGNHVDRPLTKTESQADYSVRRFTEWQLFDIAHEDGEECNWYSVKSAASGIDLRLSICYVGEQVDDVEASKMLKKRIHECASSEDFLTTKRQKQDETTETVLSNHQPGTSATVAAVVTEEEESPEPESAPDCLHILHAEADNEPLTSSWEVIPPSTEDTAPTTTHVAAASGDSSDEEEEKIYYPEAECDSEDEIEAKIDHHSNDTPTATTSESGNSLSRTVTPLASTEPTATVTSNRERLTEIGRRARRLVGFNNTGNVCVWPSEQVLAHLVLKRGAHEFAHKAVVELGAGQCGLAGLCAALIGRARSVWLTDGNVECAANLDKIVRWNAMQHVITSNILRWNGGISDEKSGKFDILLAADCCFFDEAREDLLECTTRLLKPGGVAWFVQPSRNHTAEKFAELCRKSQKFSSVTISRRYDADITFMHAEFKKKYTHSAYDPNLHYPLLIECQMQQ